jgi:hypothetical protein
MKSSLIVCVAVALISRSAWGDLSSGEANKNARDWTNLDGKEIKAEYLGTLEGDVALRLRDGKIVMVPIIKLSNEDNEFLKDNPLAYRSAWQAWPRDAGMMMQYPEVKSEPSDSNGVVYVTPRFRFHSDVNLSPSLMKDLSRVFELTYHLHSMSPFGILAKPEKDLFEARLLGRLDDYRAAGGPMNSAGVYLPEKRIFLAPLELMGMKEADAGWRKVTDEYDPSTIIHELTHMLTHDMLVNLPTWANEAYAEYISNIPIKNKAFQTEPDQIREGVRDVFVRDYLKSRTPPGRELPDFGKADKIKYLNSNSVPYLYKVAKVLRMTDAEWATGQPTAGEASRPGIPTASGFGYRQPPVDRNRLPRLYRTAHLIFYNFIQIEGEKGVAKIRRFIDENKIHMARYERYREDYARYEAEWNAFTALPGVEKLEDGKVRYPAHLKPPVEPNAPFTNPDVLKLGGLDALLGGESAEIVGGRIEEALISDLGINLRFVEHPR